ncbi:hypothetical protein K435DRAFT_468382 [Dendrothele bispora CBS 962.96]|uniref:Uncharacterized protein n=1 Tax=Dendrothele bispora (strain CBS 962.96) TaxID=1314807 RepID=A0A4S8MDE5_DENBC|nr:hypothetical protein K435DRAFT_468382 [Dendrothele bispora CBS 962.96]
MLSLSCLPRSFSLSLVLFSLSTALALLHLDKMLFPAVPLPLVEKRNSGSFSMAVHLAPPVSLNNFSPLPIQVCCARFHRCHRSSSLLSSHPYSLSSSGLPLEHFQHPSLCLAACSTGSFGLVLSITLSAHIPTWANVWLRYWSKSSSECGGSKACGLEASFCLYLLVGITSGYLWRRLFGECPDEEWDAYLANYTLNLPNRAGTFEPFKSFRDQWFASKSSRNSTDGGPMIFPSTPNTLSTHPSPFHRNNFLLAVSSIPTQSTRI